MDDLDFEQRSMAGLLAKFRIDYSSLKLLPDITKKASDSTIRFFDELIEDFRRPDINMEGSYISLPHICIFTTFTFHFLRAHYESGIAGKSRQNKSSFAST